MLRKRPPPWPTAAGRAAVVRFTGGPLAVTADNAPAWGRLLDLVAEGVGRRRLILDLADVEFQSVAGLAVLVRLHRRLRARGGRLVLRDPDDHLDDLCDAAGVAGLFEVRRSAVALRS
jgi:anti-anti-sigma factor